LLLYALIGFTVTTTTIFLAGVIADLAAFRCCRKIWVSAELDHERRRDGY
jgi:uncharacterized membrane protein HdeD (DUF308 family)